MIDEKKLAAEIADFKKTFGPDERNRNRDYTAGYISALSAVEGMLAEQQKTCEWIPTKEKYPEKAGEYTVTISGASKATVLEFDGRCWFDEGDEVYAVSAWMRLPEPWEDE